MKLVVDGAKKGPVLGDLYGIFFEDLNHAADGGLYPELVRNRSFEFDEIDHKGYNGLTAWSQIGTADEVTVSIQDNNSRNSRNPHYAMVLNKVDGIELGICNEGYAGGIHLEQGKNYEFTCIASIENEAETVLHLHIYEKEKAQSKETLIASGEVILGGAGWKKYQVTLQAKKTGDGILCLTSRKAGRICYDFVSLFPQDTFCKRENGVRSDIAQMLLELKPRFMRFPGGCLVHDGSLDPEARDSLYRWKNTLGPIEDRPARRNNWGYNQTLGLGYYEYFQLCEDLNCKPLPVLPGGYNPHRREQVPIEELGEWVQEALDLIEFANGGADTTWGKARTKLGHPAPFGLEYLAIGNEEVGEPFFERYPYFHKAIKEQYPDIKLINSAGPFAAGGEFERGWDSAKKEHSDLVDEHYYMAPEWFVANHKRYDAYNVEDPKVFLGEYASWGNTYYNALVEASYMVGLERNADKVGLACYAPLLCNEAYVNWQPDMIWFNNSRVYGSANYYVQKLFMEHLGDCELSIHMVTDEEALGKQGHNEQTTDLCGQITLGSNRAKVSYKNVTLTNLDTGECQGFEDIQIDKEHEFVPLSDTTWSNYELSMSLTQREGFNGFLVEFAKRDEKNTCLFELGGWQNQDLAISQKTEGRGSCLSQYQFFVETGKTYQVVLTVTKGHIRVKIDGQIYQDIDVLSPELEPLYYTAAKDEASGDIVIKAVNLKETECQVDLSVSNEVMPVESIVKVYSLSGYELEDRNCMEEPKKVHIKEQTVIRKGNTLTYCFPKQSVTVLRLKTSE